MLACEPSEAPVVEELNLGLEVDNGISLNGTSLHGSWLQGVGLRMLSRLRAHSSRFPIWRPTFRSGLSTAAVRNPAATGGNPYGGVGPNGTSLGGVQRDDLVDLVLDGDLSVDELVGAELEGTSTNGQATLLKIAGVASGVGENSDLLYYAVYAAEGPEWTPLCGESDDGEPIPVLAIPGKWNYATGTPSGGAWSGTSREFSFACRGSSIAKCMEAGYKPWISPDSSGGEIRYREQEDAAEANHLQACVRMLRADYCGDGTSHTVDGRRISVWDSMGLHEQSQRSWFVEAAWSANGAEWVSGIRRVLFRNQAAPRCYRDKLLGWGERMELHHQGLNVNSEAGMRHKGVLLINRFEDQLVVDSSSRR